MSKYGKPLAMPSDTTFTLAPHTRKVRAGRVMLQRSTAYLLCFYCVPGARRRGARSDSRDQRQRGARVAVPPAGARTPSLTVTLTLALTLALTVRTARAGRFTHLLTHPLPHLLTRLLSTRVQARSPAFWARLREMTAQHHSLLAFGLEGSFHRRGLGSVLPVRARVRVRVGVRVLGSGVGSGF